MWMSEARSRSAWVMIICTTCDDRRVVVGRRGLGVRRPRGAAPSRASKTWTWVLDAGERAVAGVDGAQQVGLARRAARTTGRPMTSRESLGGRHAPVGDRHDDRVRRSIDQRQRRAGRCASARAAARAPPAAGSTARRSISSQRALRGQRLRSGRARRARPARPAAARAQRRVRRAARSQRGDDVCCGGDQAASEQVSPSRPPADVAVTSVAPVASAAAPAPRERRASFAARRPGGHAHQATLPASRGSGRSISSRVEAARDRVLVADDAVLDQARTATARG